TDRPATDLVGSETPVRPASFASFAIRPGVMSGVPVIFSSLRLSDTVERPLKPMKIATTPNVTRTAPAAKPPHSKSLRIRSPFDRTAVETRFAAMVLMSCLRSLWWFRDWPQSSREPFIRHRGRAADLLGAAREPVAVKYGALRRSER